MNWISIIQLDNRDFFGLRKQIDFSHRISDKKNTKRFKEFIE